MTEWIITSSTLIAVVVLARFVFKGRISRRLQYALWGIVLVRLLLPFSLLSSPISIMNVVSLQGATYEQPPATPVTLPSQLIVGITENLPTVPVSNTSSSDVLVSAAKGLTPPMQAWIIGTVIIGLWFAGTNLTFYTRLCKLRKTLPDVECKLPVYVAEHVASPCLYGIARPSVYITPKAAENRISTSHVLAHELCHYQHGDHVWSILRGLCLAIWWWNPLVWLAAFLSRDDSELACDEAVIRLLGADSRLAYCHTVLEMVAVRKAPSGLLCAATTMNSGKRSLKERLNLIIKIPKTFVSAIVSVLLIAVISVGCTFTGAEVQPQDLSLLSVGLHEPTSVMTGYNSFNLSLTPGQFHSPYTRFMGTLVQQVWLEDGEYHFSFEGDPQQFALRAPRGAALIELKPSDTTTLVIKRGSYYLCLTNKTEGPGAFTVRWHK